MKKRLGIICLMASVTLSTSVRGEEIRVFGPGGSTVPGSTAGSSVASEQEYRIGSGDVLEVSVWQNPDMTKEVTVRYDGKVSYPLVGDVLAAGLTPQSLDNEITERLREFIRNPQVTVTVKQFRSRQVIVLGRVGTSGVQNLEGNTRILEILTRAGLDLATADLTKITVIRATGEVVNVDLHSLLYERRFDQNIILRAGDSIFVPDKEAASSAQGELMVLGEVNKAGGQRFSLERPFTVKEALLAAGGITGEADLTTAKVVRADGIQEPVDLNRLIFRGDMTQDLALYQGDVLYVPRRTKIRVYLLGMVGKPGLFELEPEDMNLLRILAKAGPAQFGAVLSDVKVVRDYPQNPKVMSANVDALLYRGDLSQNIPLKDGDVVYVPESFLSNVLDVLNRVLGPFNGTLSTIVNVERVSNGEASSTGNIIR